MNKITFKKMLVVSLVASIVFIFSYFKVALSLEYNWWEQFNKNKHNLILYLPFEEGKGNETEDAVSRDKIDIKNSKWVDGKRDMPLIFTGENSFSIEDSPLLHLNKKFSIEVWCYPESLDGGYVLLKKYSYGFPVLSGESKVGCYLRSNTKEDKGITTPNICEVNKWQHYVMTYDGEIVKIYYNGNYVNGYTLNIDVSESENPILMGNSEGWGNKNFKGKIGLARIYSSVLNEEEIKENYKNLEGNAKIARKESIALEVPNFYGIDTGNALYFNGKDTYIEIPDSPKLNPSTGFTIGAWIKPEELMQNDEKGQRYIISKGDGINSGYQLHTYYNNGLAGVIVTEKNAYTIKASNVLKKDEWQHVVLSWDGKIAQLLVNGEPVGKPVITEGCLKPLRDSLCIGKSPDKSDMIFKGNIDEVKIFDRSFMPEDEEFKTVGEKVTVSSSNSDPSGIGHRSRYVEGLKEKRKPLIDFENLDNWKVEYFKGVTKGELYRSQERMLWGNYVGKIVFQNGKYEVKNKDKEKIKIFPGKPVNIENSFDGINLWVFGNYYYKPGGVTLSIQIEDAEEKIHDIILDDRLGPHVDTHLVFWGGWSIVNCRLPEKISAPAKFISLTFSKIISDNEQKIFIDNLEFYNVDNGPVTYRIPGWKELNFPTTPDTILPSLTKDTSYKNQVVKKDKIISLVYEGNDERIEYQYLPEKGTLSDITVIHNDSFKFNPSKNGGIVLEIDKVEYQPDSESVKKNLKKIDIQDNKVVTEWDYEVEGNAFKVWIELRIKQKSLVVDIKSDTKFVKEIRIGYAENIAEPKIVEVPYLVIGGGLHESKYPGILYSKGVFISAFMDWYNSEASEFFGESKVMNSNSAVYNGGSYYLPDTDGKKNTPGERIFYTVSGKFSEVLPNIPNPPSPYLEVTKKQVWGGQFWDISKEDYMDILNKKKPSYFEQQYRFWETIKNYGANNITVQPNFNTINKYFSDIDEGNPGTTIDIDPALGGEDGAKELIYKLQNKLGYLSVPYTNYTVLNPLYYQYWDENWICLYHNKAWKYGSGPAYLVKPSKSLEYQEKFNSIIEKKFNPNASYADQYTARDLWFCTDYDSRIPEAGKFSPAFRIYGKLLQEQRKHFGGPVYSEGNMQWIFSGLCDGNYGMLPEIGQPLIVDFKLLKVKPLSLDFGYHLRYYFGERIHWWLANEIAFGHTGMLYGRSWDPPNKPRIKDVLKSYFMIQQVQQLYATTPVDEIKYNDSGRLVNTEEAIKSDVYKNNQVYIKYNNGLEVFVNLGNSNWEVQTKEGKYLLPPDGFVVSLQGKFLEYTALLNGKRADFVKCDEYIYCDGLGNETDFGAVKCNYGYLIKKEKDALWITPAPFEKEETVTLNLKELYPELSGLKELRIIPCNEKGSELLFFTSNLENGLLSLKLKEDVFKYRVSR